MKMNGRARPPVEPLRLNYHCADKPLNTQPSPRPDRLRLHHPLRSVLLSIYVSLSPCSVTIGDEPGDGAVITA